MENLSPNHLSHSSVYSVKRVFCRGLYGRYENAVFDFKNKFAFLDFTVFSKHSQRLLSTVECCTYTITKKILILMLKQSTIVDCPADSYSWSNSDDAD